ncbi:lipopolysaccharide biosynthesis protein [Bacteroidia bacterium]|nr:lipopolysaccharide biosynthesis protein [Bacteroidia bacterium]
MAESTLKQKTANGLLWGGISNGVQQLLNVVFGIYLARTLNQTDYGMVGVLAIFTGIAATIVNSGFAVALTNKKEATHKDYNAVFWFTVFVGLGLYVALFFCAPLIARFYKQPELTNLSRFLFLGFVMGGIGTASSTVMFKKLMVKQQSIICLIALLISLSVSLLLALKGYAYWALAVQTVLQLALGNILTFIFAPWKPSLLFDFSPLKQMFSFSMKLFVTNIFSIINSNIFSVIFGKFYSVEQVGIYNQGQKWMGMGNLFIAGMMNSVSQPVLVHVNEDKNRQVNILRKLIRFGAFVSFPLMLGLAFVGREFIVLTIGEKWLESVPFLQLFCIWGAFIFLSTLYTNLIFTHSKSNLFMYGMMITGLLQLLVVFLMYPFGIFPMVIGFLSINFFSLLIWQYFVNKLIGLQLKYVLKDILPYLLITLGCFFIAWLLTKNIVNLYALISLKIAISVALYVVVLQLSHAIIFKESINFLLKRK